MTLFCIFFLPITQIKVTSKLIQNIKNLRKTANYYMILVVGLYMPLSAKQKRGRPMTNNEKSLMMHEQWNGKLEIVSKAPVKSREDLAIAYTPGVAEPCKVIARDKEEAYKYTMKANTVAVVSDGSAVLGLGNIGPHAAMPVMEGKAVLFKEFGGVNAIPICLDTQDTEEIIKAGFLTLVNRILWQKPHNCGFFYVKFIKF